MYFLKKKIVLHGFKKLLGKLEESLAEMAQNKWQLRLHPPTANTLRCRGYLLECFKSSRM